jgi:hypothetical protein
VDDDPLLQQIQAAYPADSWFLDPQNLAELTRERGLWWRGQAVAVPDYDGLRLQCLQNAHDSPAGGHFGVRKTRELARRLYWWPKMKDDIDKHVRECATCQRNKSPNHAPYGELQPLPVPDELWEMISIDFIVKLPKTRRGHDSVLVVVDRLSKYAIFTPCKEKGLTSQELVHILEDKVIGDKSYPKMIISDRDVRATAGYYQDWCKRHQIESRLTTAYHSRANGQAERMNLILENYLRSYVNSSLDNWDELLPDAQLAINNSFQESIKTTPFYLNHGRHPWLPGVTFKRVGLVNEDKEAEKADREAILETWSAERRHAVAVARKCLKEAQIKAKQQFDKRRLPKEFQAGQRVLLSTRNLKFKGLNCTKLMPRFIGPFTIAETVGTTSYKLTLPDVMKVHPVFHAELLREYHGNDFTPPPLYECEDGTVFWEIDRLSKVRGTGNRRQYLIEWKGFGREFDSWEPESVLKVDCPEAITEFEEWQKSQPQRLKNQRRR